jgi:hypothetical protein
MAAARLAPKAPDGESEAVTIAIPTVVFLFLMMVIGVGSMRRRVVNGYANRLRDRHPLRALFVSKINRGFVGLSLDGQGLLLGDRRHEKIYPFAEVSSVEIIHTGEKGRLRQLIVRITVKDEAHPVHDYAIFDWPNNRGPKEDQPHVQSMIDQAKRIRAMVIDGMARAA